MYVYQLNFCGPLLCLSTCISLYIAVLQHELCPLARELCKGGCPVGLRRELWGRALTLNTSSPEVRGLEYVK